MSRRTLPRIAEVAPGPMPLTLRVRWRDGGENLVDVSGPVGVFRCYAKLHDDPALFARVGVGEHGTDVTWTDEIDMSADTLWRLAQEQSGQTMTAASFRRWRERHGYTLDGAARARGADPKQANCLRRRCGQECAATAHIT
jgi:hypothetical protein